MAGFWRRKSSSSPKTSKEQSKQQQSNQIQDSKNHVSSNNQKSSSSSSPKDKQRQSLEIRISPSLSKEYTSSSSGFSGFDSDSGEKKIQLPLPTPSGTDLGFIATPNSSVSSSGSSSAEDHGGSNDICLATTTLSGGYRSPIDNRGNGDVKYYTRSRSPVPGSSSPRPGSRSPGPRSRVASRPQSPLHPNMGGTNMDSPTGRLEEGKNQAHPLPLPPGSPSPSSPSSLQSTRSAVVTETVALSKWKKGKLLGRGTFGHVYLGFNSESGQMCAIKEVKVVTDDQSSKECLKQLNQEINLLSQLSHPNIVRYHGSELSEDRLSVYLEYVSGGSIHKLLQEYGAFREPVIQNYTRQILSGLAYLHGLNTVHRDIKGANILVDPNGEIKLADFGMAKSITGCSSMLSFKGSPYWMAPEVVMNTNGYSLAVDIWSLGCTIIEMATSKPPWHQYEGVAAIFKIGNSRDMPDIPDHLSNDAKCFIKLCLQRDPSARPTAAKLLDHAFIRDQAMSRVANFNITRDAFPHTFDGSRTPPVLELHSNRTSIPSCDSDFAINPGFVNHRVTRNARDHNARMITSLPVSPSSSPLRQLGPAYQSCYVSPPHQAYAMVGNGYNGSDHQSLHPIRRNTAYTLDPLIENKLLLAHHRAQNSFEMDGITDTNVFALSPLKVTPRIHTRLKNHTDWS